MFQPRSRRVSNEVTVGEVTVGEVETVRELVVLEEPSESHQGDRSPTKTERDLDEITKLPMEQTQSSETVRKLVIPEA
ncbi:MAG: hypothetical protein B0A82_08680 [Alkalinema sp. CACIAM 70d]|nr:MAG: hypothetical protein B0A82_08680 [Alkalinema sp. CACIAM 70d]